MKVVARFHVIGVAVVSAALACGSEPEPKAASAPASPPAVQREPVARAPLLAGAFRLSVVGDRIDLEAAQAERGAILAQLGGQLGFELVVGEPPLAPLRVDLRLEDETPDAVLAALLPDLGFRVEYRSDPTGQGHRLARVVVGEVGVEPTPPVAAAPPQRDRASRWQRQVPRRSEAELARLRAEHEAREAAARTALDSEDPVVRAEAISDVDIEGPGRDRIFALAEEDPDPTVRAEAVKLLGEEESMAARDALYAALQDPAPQVVMEALDWIEAVGDASSIPALQDVAEQNPDPRIQQRAIDIANFLED